MQIKVAEPRPRTLRRKLKRGIWPAAHHPKLAWSQADARLQHASQGEAPFLSDCTIWLPSVNRCSDLLYLTDLQRKTSRFARRRLLPTSDSWGAKWPSSTATAAFLWHWGYIKKHWDDVISIGPHPISHMLLYVSGSCVYIYPLLFACEYRSLMPVVARYLSVALCTIFSASLSKAWRTQTLLVRTYLRSNTTMQNRYWLSVLRYQLCAFSSLAWDLSLVHCKTLNLAWTIGSVWAVL